LVGLSGVVLFFRILRGDGPGLVVLSRAVTTTTFGEALRAVVVVVQTDVDTASHSFPPV